MVNFELDWYAYPLTIVVGFLVGFINIMAGGGSILSLPLLMFLGLPANVANGTNRISILLLNIVGIRNYQKKHSIPFRSDLRFILPTLIGSVLGAFLAVDLDKDLFQKIIGVFLLIFFFLLLYKPKQWLEGNQKLHNQKHWWQYPLFFCIGIYGGFIQMGAGFFLLGSFVLGAGYDLLRANILKVLIILLYTPFVLAIFFWHGQVDIILGLILGIGSSIGAYVGSKMAMEKGTKFIRYILLTIILFSAGKFLGLFDLVLTLFS